MQKTVSWFAAWGIPKGSGMNLIKIAGMVMAFVTGKTWVWMTVSTQRREVRVVAHLRS